MCWIFCPELGWHEHPWHAICGCSSFDVCHSFVQLNSFSVGSGPKEFNHFCWSHLNKHGLEAEDCTQVESSTPLRKPHLTWFNGLWNVILCKCYFSASATTKPKNFTIFFKQMSAFSSKLWLQRRQKYLRNVKIY